MIVELGECDVGTAKVAVEQGLMAVSLCQGIPNFLKRPELERTCRRIEDEFADPSSPARSRELVQ